jgi:hypothetical protein
MDRIQELRRAYGWLKSYAASLPPAQNNPALPTSFVADYGRIHGAIERALDQSLGDFAPSTLRLRTDDYSDPWYQTAEVFSKASQLLGFLDYGYSVEEKRLEVESLFKAIHDPELQERCGDLILGTGPFDRVINQATLVLEDRLRMRAGLDRASFGAGLVSAAVKGDPTESRIVFSTVKSEQEGYANIIRGLMQALRNETHHTVADNFSREDALSICGFIDRILRLIDRSIVNK